MKKIKRKHILISIAILFIIFVAQNRYFNNETNPNFLLASANQNDIEEILIMESQKCKHCIIPKQWFSKGGWLNPSVAGMLDGAYEAGVSIKELASFLYKYSTDADFRKQTNKQVGEIWNQRDLIYKIFAKEIKKLCLDLGGNSGSIKAEYLMGKLIFAAGGIIAGTGKGTEAIKLSKHIAKILRKLKLAQKLDKIKINCPPCLLLYKKTGKLRKNLLSKTNLPTTKALLNSEWKKSRKTWNVFIKDYEAHHIIPKSLLEKSEALQFYFNNGGKLKFNSIENGIMLKKVSKGGIHARHDNYSQYIFREINAINNKIEISNYSKIIKIKMYNKEIELLISKTKSKIINTCIKNNKKLNKIFK